MNTLKQISESNPSTYKVIDSAALRGEIKSLNDRIEILIYPNTHKNVTRKSAYKFGLCEGI